MPKRGITGIDIATRQRSMLDWSTWWNLLPDPDEILSRVPDGREKYRQLLYDGHTWSQYSSRMSGSRSREIKIKDNGGGTRAYDLIDRINKNFNTDSIIIDIIQAVFYGYSPIEITWGAEGNVWAPKKIAGKPWEWFAFDAENRIRFLSHAAPITGELIPDYKFLVPTHFGSYKNPYGEKLLSRVFWPVLFKKGGLKFWAMMCEKFGMPWGVGTVPIGATPEEKEALYNAIAMTIQDGVLVKKEDEEVELISAGGSAGMNGNPIYDGLYNACNAEISKAIVGQTLTAQEGQRSGSYALGTVHAGIREDLVEADGKMIKEVFDNLYQWVIEFNFPPGTKAPEFVFYQEEAIQLDRAERDEKLYSQGVRFKRVYYIRNYNLKEDEIESKIQGGKTNGAAPQFAERIPEDEEILESASAKGQEVFDGSLDPVREMIQNAKSYDEIKEKLYDMYPDIDKVEFSGLLQRALIFQAMSAYVDSSESTT